MVFWWNRRGAKSQRPDKTESSEDWTAQDYDSVEQRVREIAAFNCDLHVDSITVDTEFGDIDDSVGNVEIVMECEEVFEVEIPDDDAQNLTPVGQLTYYIAHKLNLAP